VTVEKVKFVSELQQVCGFLQVLQFPPPIKLTADITGILLKVALNTIAPSLPPPNHNNTNHFSG
jgi:hypothetical protein